MMRTALIDADIIAYAAAFSEQRDVDWGDGIVTRDLGEVTDAFTYARVAIEKYAEDVRADRALVCLSCPTAAGWRVKLLPTYKAGRGEKPVYLNDVKQYMRETFETIERPALEADDVMGILATHPRLITGQKVIVSIDKDMQTIPARLYNPRTGSKRVITEHEADYFHMMQTLMGDSVDNYKGCPGVGPKRAAAILEDSVALFGSMWAAVVDAFQQRGLTEDDALLQARVARICRASDYDLKRKEVKLWTPPPQRST